MVPSAISKHYRGVYVWYPVTILGRHGQGLIIIASIHKCCFCKHSRLFSPFSFPSFLLYRSKHSRLFSLCDSSSVFSSLLSSRSAFSSVLPPLGPRVFPSTSSWQAAVQTENSSPDHHLTAHPPPSLTVSYEVSVGCLNLSCLRW